MSEPQSDRERRRAERLKAAGQAERRERMRMFAGYGAAGVLVLAIVVGLFVAITAGNDDEGEEAALPEAAAIHPQSGFVHGVEPDSREGTPPPPVEVARLDEAAERANCELRLDLPDEGNRHIDEDADRPEYETNPPTSGNHHVEQQADGAYAEKPDAIHTVHSLEHGRVLFQYSPELTEQEQLEIKGVFDEAPSALMLFPNPGMPWAVAATAWQQKIGCESYEGAATLDALRAFRDVYLGQGPEAVPVVLG